MRRVKIIQNTDAKAFTDEMNTFYDRLPRGSIIESKIYYDPTADLSFVATVDYFEPEEAELQSESDNH